MAMYACRQPFLWEQLPETPAPGLKDVEEHIRILSQFDAPLVRELERRRGHGRDDYPVVAMWNFFAIASLLHHGRRARMLEELGRNSGLARILGFLRKPDGRYRIPEQYVCSRFEKILREPGIQALVKDVHAATVKALKKELPGFGRHLGLDASDLGAWARPPSKDGTRPSSDPDASWSVKTKRRVNSEGQIEEVKKATFGYKMYATVDTDYAAVVAVETTTGKANDHAQVRPQIEQAVENLGEGVIETLAMDKGFDSTEVVETCTEFGVLPIVPFRDVPKNLDQMPARDREIPLQQTGNTVRDKYTGEVSCYDFSGPEPVKRAMDYAGYEADRETHKFRCPEAALGKKCPFFDECSAGSNGPNSRQVRIPTSTDTRRFAPVYPRSRRWKRLYNTRSATERFNSYAKEVLVVNDFCVRGRPAVNLRVLIVAITVNLITLRRAKRSQQEGEATATVAA